MKKFTAAFVMLFALGGLCRAAETSATAQSGGRAQAQATTQNVLTTPSTVRTTAGTTGTTITSGPLDRMRFWGTLKTDDPPTTQPAMVSFMRGRIGVQITNPRDYLQGTYHSQPQGESIKFTATVQSRRPGGLGRQTWEGQVRATALTATVKTQTEGGTVTESVFTGKTEPSLRGGMRGMPPELRSRRPLVGPGMRPRRGPTTGTLNLQSLNRPQRTRTGEVPAVPTAAPKK